MLGLAGARGIRESLSLSLSVSDDISTPAPLVAPRVAPQAQSPPQPLRSKRSHQVLILPPSLVPICHGIQLEKRRKEYLIRTGHSSDFFCLHGLLLLVVGWLLGFKDGKCLAYLKPSWDKKSLAGKSQPSLARLARRKIKKSSIPVFPKFFIRRLSFPEARRCTLVIYCRSHSSSTIQFGNPPPPTPPSYPTPPHPTLSLSLSPSLFVSRSVSLSFLAIMN